MNNETLKKRLDEFLQTHYEGRSGSFVGSDEGYDKNVTNDCFSAQNIVSLQKH